MSELGYVPNAQARNLARRRSGVIGFAVPEISNPYFGAIADHVVEAVERHGLLALLCSTRSQEVRQASYIELLASGAIDGMLYLGSFRSNDRLAAAIEGGLPVVVADEPIAGLPPVHTVVMDDYAGGYQAASYLVALGHRRIAFVSGPAETHGIRVPEDLSIVGFDDIRFSRYVRPRLTTIRSPLDRSPQVGVELLFEQLQDSGAKARTEVLPVELVIRESAVPPAGSAG